MLASLVPIFVTLLQFQRHFSGFQYNLSQRIPKFRLFQTRNLSIFESFIFIKIQIPTIPTYLDSICEKKNRPKKVTFVCVYESVYRGNTIEGVNNIL